MTELTLNIFIGVFSGILTSIVIWGAVQFFKNLFIPWYQQSIYRGIDISGEWISNSEFSGGVVVEQTIQVKQSGHKIHGTIISKSRVPSKGESIGYFNFVGEIFDNYVDIEYTIRDKKYVSRGSILLKVRDGGDNLAGGLVAIDRQTSDIMVSLNIIWKRSR